MNQNVTHYLASPTTHTALQLVKARLTAESVKTTAQQSRTLFVFKNRKLS